MLFLSFLAPIITLFAFLTIECQAIDPGCCGSEDYALFPPAEVNFRNDTVLEINEGWQPFFFGSSGTWAVPSSTSSAFYTNYTVPVVVRIIDTYKPGDRFALYLNGQFLGNTSLGNANSTLYTPYPNEAWVQANFSHGEWLLPAGLHRFTIKTLVNVDPAGQPGGAYIRVDANEKILCGNCRPFCSPDGPCKCFPVPDANNPPGCCANNPPKVFPICKEASGVFTMIKGQFTRDQGAAACAQINLRLAEIDSFNFDGANQFAYICNGNAVAQSWIRSWNGDNYQDACLVLSSGSFGGTGAINAQPCLNKYYVLCQA